VNVLTQYCVYAALKLTHHVGLRHHYEGNRTILPHICALVVDLNLEVRNFIEVEDVVSWEFEHHLSSLVDALLLGLDVPQNQPAEVPLKGYTGGSAVDHDWRIQQSETIFQMLRFLYLGLGDDEEAVHRGATADAIEERLGKGKQGDE